MRNFINIIENNLPAHRKSTDVDNNAEVVQGELLGPPRDNMSPEEAKAYLETYPAGVIHHDIFENTSYIFLRKDGRFGFWYPLQEKWGGKTVTPWDWNTDIADLRADSEGYDMDSGWWYEPIDHFTEEDEYTDWLALVNGSKPIDDLLEANFKKAVSGAVGAAALLGGGSAMAYKAGQADGEASRAAQVQQWDKASDPHVWGDGDWFSDQPEEQEAPKAPPRPFGWLSSKDKAPVQQVAPAYSKEDLFNMTATMWGEARGEGTDGMIAVGNVILNRLASGRWGKKVKGVVRHPEQFSCWNSNDPNVKLIARMAEIDSIFSKRDEGFDEWFEKFSKSPDAPRYKKWIEAKKLARKLLTDRGTDVTNGANHYHASYVKPFWVPHMKEKTATVGNHIFYDDGLSKSST